LRTKRNPLIPKIIFLFNYFHKFTETLQNYTMKFLIIPNIKETEPQYVKTGENTMLFKGFDSKISGLVIHLDNANGNNFSSNIIDTSIDFDIDVTNVGNIWFEYDDTDKEYEIILEVEN